MKKLLILVIALALVGGVAMAQVTLSGQVETRVQIGEDSVSDASMDNRVQVNAKVDDYNSATIRLRTTGDHDGTVDAYLDRAFVTTDLGGLLGTDDAGIGLTMQTGMNEWGYGNRTRIDAYLKSGFRGSGMVNQMSLFTAAGVHLRANVMGLANVYAITGLAEQDLKESASDPGEDADMRSFIGLDGAVDVGVGNVVYEAIYRRADANNSQFGVGGGLVGAELIDDLTLGLTTSWVFEIDDPGALGAEWSYNAVLQAKYAGLAQLDFVLSGVDVEDNEVDSLLIALGLTPVDFASLQFGVGLALGDSYEEVFDGFDASVQLGAGALRLRFGYMHVNDDQVSWGARVIPAEFARSNTVSGMYLRALLTY